MRYTPSAINKRGHRSSSAQWRIPDPIIVFESLAYLEGWLHPTLLKFRLPLTSWAQKRGMKPIQKHFNDAAQHCLLWFAVHQLVVTYAAGLTVHSLKTPLEAGIDGEFPSRNGKARQWRFHPHGDRSSSPQRRPKTRGKATEGWHSRWRCRGGRFRRHPPW